MVRYCLEMPHGTIRHFPAGTYNEQMKDWTGRLELRLINVVHSIWYAFKYLGPSKWGPDEMRMAKMAEPVRPKPIPPTRRLDWLIRRLWPGSRWTYDITWSLRDIDG
jgi:hypothetical protein